MVNTEDSFLVYNHRHRDPYHSNQVTTSILSYQLLLAVLLHDYRAQSTAEHDECAVWFLSLPVKYSENFHQLQICQQSSEPKSKLKETFASIVDLLREDINKTGCSCRNI